MNEDRLDLQTTILQNIRDGVIATDLEGRILYWNEGAKTIFGYTSRDMIGESVSRLYPSMELGNVHRDIESILKGKHRESEWEGLRRDGRRVCLHLRTSVIKDHTEEPKALLGIARDITQQKKADQALRESERLYRAVGESIDFGVWACDPKGRLTHMSDSFINLLGLSRNQNISDGWLNALDPNEREAIMTAWRECIAQGKVWNRRYRILGADGQYHLVHTHAAPVRDETDKIVCWAGLNLDLSKL